MLSSDAASMYVYSDYTGHSFVSACVGPDGLARRIEVMCWSVEAASCDVVYS